MTLAAWLSKYPDFMRDDFQQYYGLNIDDIGVVFSVHHAATLAVMLPTQSRVISIAAPYASWTLDNHLLAAAVNALRDLVWLESDYKRRQSNRPKPIEPPKAKSNTDAVLLDSDDYLEQLKMMREVAYGD